VPISTHFRASSFTAFPRKGENIQLFRIDNMGKLPPYGGECFPDAIHAAPATIARSGGKVAANIRKDSRQLAISAPAGAGHSFAPVVKGNGLLPFVIFPPFDLQSDGLLLRKLAESQGAFFKCGHFLFHVFCFWFLTIRAW